MILSDDIRYLTNRALWETENLIKCISDELWNKRLERNQVENYFYRIKGKIENYADKLNDNDLAQNPDNCDLSCFRLILGQFRHWHRHMGIIYGFIITDTGTWPYVLNMDGEYPKEPMPNYY